MVFNDNIYPFKTRLNLSHCSNKSSVLLVFIFFSVNCLIIIKLVCLMTFKEKLLTFSMTLNKLIDHFFLLKIQIDAINLSNAHGRLIKIRSVLFEKKLILDLLR